MDQSEAGWERTEKKEYKRFPLAVALGALALVARLPAEHVRLDLHFLR